MKKTRFRGNIMRYEIMGGCLVKNMKKRYKATIQGKDYTIVGTKSDTHMDVVIDTINQQLEQIKELSEKITNEEAAILVAVNAVSDQIEMQEEILSKENDIEEYDDLKENTD